MYDEKLYILTLLTLFCYESKGIMRRKNKADINEANRKLLEIVNERKYIGVENVIATGDLNLIRQFSAIILGVTSQFSALDTEILAGDQKNSIDKIAMLVISKTL